MSNFKSLKQYKEEKYAGKFFLANDGDFADVVFLYRDEDEMMVGDAHYIKSPEYSGYVECNGHGCPACAANLRKTTKLFIPLYNIQKDAFEFWDRSEKFSSVVHAAVFQKEANPSNVVFRITRRGAANSTDTRYEIFVIARNDVMSYDQILEKFNLTFPEFYGTICKEVPNDQMQKWIRARDSQEESYDGSYSELSAMTPRVSAPIAHDPISMPSEIDALPDPDFGDDNEADFD